MEAVGQPVAAGLAVPGRMLSVLGGRSPGDGGALRAGQERTHGEGHDENQQGAHQGLVQGLHATTP